MATQTANDSPGLLLKERIAFDRIATGLSGNARRKRSQRAHVLASLLLADVAVILLSIIAWSLLYPSGNITEQQAKILAAILIPVHLIVGINGGAFQILVSEKRIVPSGRAISAFVISSISVLMFVFFTKANEDFSRVVVTGVILTSLAGISGMRWLINRWATHYIGPHPFATLCIYDRVPMTPDPEFNRVSAQQLALTADAASPETVGRLAALCQDFDRIVIHCQADDRMAWAFILKSVSIPGEISVPEIHALNPVAIHQRSGKTCIQVSVGPLKWYQRIIKRLFDQCAVLVAAPLLIPIFVIIGLLIKLDSKGPVFFLQPRIGLNNRLFYIYKFRSMREEELDHDGEQSTQRDDPRITRVGHFLRRWSIDELPQLINVLKGEMSIVGPRPHARSSRAGERLFWEVDSAYWHRHAVKPGITGLAQIRGFRGNTFHEEHLRDRLKSDLEYVANWSLSGDISIILRTLFVLSHDNAF